MKLITAVALFALMLTSCATKNTDFAIIKGQYTGVRKGKEIHLCKVEHGKTNIVAVTQFGRDGRFGFVHSVEEPALYVVNVVVEEVQRKVRQDHDLTRFYLENGTELEIQINDGSYQLTHTNSDKNKLLSQWNSQADSMFTYSHGFTYNRLDYTNFFPLLPGFVEQGEAFKSTIATGDADYDELMKLMVDTDLAMSALRMLYTPRSKHPEKADYPEFYDVLISEYRPESERLIELPNGFDYINVFTMHATSILPERPSRDAYLSTNLSYIYNDLLKGYYAVNNLKRFSSYDADFVTFSKEVQPYLKNEYLKEAFKAHEMSIRKFEEGAPAFDFAGNDVNGKEHKLSDYKGKLVYIDVWATWCGPCKAEIPHLKELEAKFHGQDIEFMSISVDKLKDKQKWIDYVKEEKLKGIQIMADKAFDSDVAKAYSINAIPRFMLIDKEGNIVSTDAPRPSSDRIEGLLKSLL